jgi:hypothetical protein
MKKQITILVLILTAASYSYAQDAPCNDAVIMNTTGKWYRPKANPYVPPDKTNFTKPQQLAIAARMEEMYKMMLKAIPVPMGLDGGWDYRNYDEEFASKVKYITTRDGDVQMDYVKQNRLSCYDCLWSFWDFNCYTGKLGRSYPGDPMAGINITVNNFGALLNEAFNDEYTLIDGRTIHRKQTVQGSWKGYDLMWEGGLGRELHSSRYVLIHRKGELPYTPVTRKQYLDRAFIELNKFYDDMIKGIDLMPVRSLEEQETLKKKTLEDYQKKYGSDPKRLKSSTDYYLMSYQTDQQQRDDRKNKTIKQKNAVIKHYQDALEKTIADNMLDSAAIVFMAPFGPSETEPVFSTEEEGGTMLVTENPGYLRKDLAKDVPQFIVINWQWNDSKPDKNLRKLFEENFEVEKLQAMIDK